MSRWVRRWTHCTALNARIGLPEAITTSLAGSAAEFATSLSSEKLLILAAIITVYIVLGVLYESFIHPITILVYTAIRRCGRVARADVVRRDRWT